MKNVILFIAVIAMACTANAQTNKQVAGSKSMEVQFSPLNGSPISLDGGIRFRSFSTETTAFRGTVFLGGSSSSDKSFGTNSAGDEIDLVDKMSSFSIQLRPGLEWHLVGTDKLSPYYGGEVLIGFNSEKSVNEFYGGESIEEETTKSGSTQFGANAVGGMDYYFAQNIFFGAEIGAGILYESRGATKTEYTTEQDDLEVPGGSSLSGGPNVNARIRLGIIF